MNNGNIADVTTADSSSSKYKSSILGDLVADDANGALKDARTVVPLKYLSNFFRSLEMPLINCKIHLELSWTKDCIMSSVAGATTLEITNTKLYVPIVTLLTKDNVNLTKQLYEGFKRSVYWNEYKSKIETKTADNNNATRYPLDASFQRVNRLFVFVFSNTDGNANNKIERNSHRKYFLPRVDITNSNVLMDSRNFYDQPTDDQIKKYDEIRKTAKGKGGDYTTGCLLDYQYFRDHYQLIAADFITEKELDADPRTIQQIEFYGMLKTNSQVCSVLEKSKETVLEFYKETAKVL